MCNGECQDDRRSIVEEEIFLPIKGFQDYEVSNFGNIRNTKTGYFMKERSSQQGYRKVGLKNAENKRCYKHVHRLVIEAFKPNTEGKKCVDHIDNNPKNNNLSNLRYATCRENSFNRKMNKNNTSGYKGIQFYKNKWRVLIKINGRATHVGMYTTIEEARKARLEIAKRIFGEYINVCEFI